MNMDDVSTSQFGMERVFNASSARKNLTNNLALESQTLFPSPTSQHELSIDDFMSNNDELIDLLGITPQPRNDNFLKTESLNQVKRKLHLEVSEKTNENVKNISFKAPFPSPNPRKRSRTTSSCSTPSRSPGEKTRYDTSLGLLTKRFVSLMRTCPDGVLDLNYAAEQLQVQKRRIYDITNVLEGIKLIEKKSKNNVRWIASDDPPSKDISGDVNDLKQQLIDLNKEEEQIDKLIRMRQVELEHMSDSQSKLAFVTYQDIRGINSFKDQIVICIKAPQDTKLEVPDPDDKIQMLLKSTKGEIDVFLCPDPADIRANDTTSPTSDIADDDSCSSSAPSTPPNKNTNIMGKKNFRSPLVEDQNISHHLEDGHPLLFQTEDQLEADSAFMDDSSLFVPLSPVMTDSYPLFSLEDSEGIKELFDIPDEEIKSFATPSDNNKDISNTIMHIKQEPES